jgi:hypothetical protein
LSNLVDKYTPTKNSQCTMHSICVCSVAKREDKARKMRAKSKLNVRPISDQFITSMIRVTIAPCLTRCNRARTKCYRPTTLLQKRDLSHHVYVDVRDSKHQACYGERKDSKGARKRGSRVLYHIGLVSQCNPNFHTYFPALYNPISYS